MSQPLVAAFYHTLIRRSWLRLIGGDWMMNTLLMLMEKAGVPCDCMHADRTIFRHSSVTGEYASSIR